MSGESAAKKKRQEELAITWKLTLTERLNLLQILPTSGSIITLRGLRNLRERMAPSAAEIKAHNIQEVSLNGGGTGLRWNNKDEKSVPFMIDEPLQALIVKGFEQLDSAEKMTDDLLFLHDRFVPEE